MGLTCIYPLTPHQLLKEIPQLFIPIPQPDEPEAQRYKLPGLEAGGAVRAPFWNPLCSVLCHVHTRARPDPTPRFTSFHACGNTDHSLTLPPPSPSCLTSAPHLPPSPSGHQMCQAARERLRQRPSGQSSRCQHLPVRSSRMGGIGDPPGSDLSLMLHKRNYAQCTVTFTQSCRWDFLFSRCKYDKGFLSNIMHR